MTNNNKLSEREIETLKLVAQGMSNKQIASSLFISINTVKVHLRNIFEKINVESRTEATLYAIEHGIIPSPGPEFVPSPVVEPEISPTRKWFTKYWWLGVPLGIAIIVGLALILSNSPVFRSPTPTPGFVQGVATVQRWTELAPMSVARASLAVAAYDNAIYAIGGDTTEGVTGLVERYDPQSDSWRTLKSKIIPVSAVSAAVIGGEIYVPGGKQADGSATSVLEVYDPQQDSWQEKAPLPIAVYGYALATFEGRIYLFGGTDGSQYLDSAYIYDPQQDKWQPGSPMPTARAYAGAAEAGEKIFVIGGWDGEDSLAINESYTPSNEGSGKKAWEDETKMPNSGYGMGVFKLVDQVYIIGGKFTGNNPVGHFSFSLIDNIWQNIETENDNGLLPVIHSGYSSLNGYVYFVGGLLDQTIIPDNRAYKAIYTVLLPIIIDR